MRAEKFTFYVGCTTHDGKVLRRGTVRRIIAAVLADNGLTAATIFPARGLWEGAEEKTLVVEVLQAEPLPSIAVRVSHDLAAACLQDCVLYTRQTIVAQLVDSNGATAGV